MSILYTLLIEFESKEDRAKFHPFKTPMPHGGKVVACSIINEMGKLDALYNYMLIESNGNVDIAERLDEIDEQFPPT